MKTVVVTEGENDVLLLRALVGDQANGGEFVKAGGWSAADSLARSYLVDGAHDVALVVDADTHEASSAEERRRFLDYSLGSVALRTRWQVFVIVPEIESLLFEDANVLTSLVGRAVSDKDVYEGRFEPKRVLTRLAAGKPVAQLFRERLPQIDLTPLHSVSEIRHLRQFLTGARKKVAA